MASYNSSVGWRFPLGFQAFIAILTSVMLFFMPECKSQVSETHTYFIVTDS